MHLNKRDNEKLVVHFTFLEQVGAPDLQRVIHVMAGHNQGVTCFHLLGKNFQITLSD